MSKGQERIQQEAEAQQAKKDAFASSGSALYSKAIRDAGGTIVVRFLEQGQDVNWYERHEYRDPNSKYPDHFTCLKEIGINDCPGCQAGLPIKLHTVYNLIFRNRPVFQKDSEGKVLKDQANNPVIIGHEDAVVYWRVASTTADMLRRRDTKYQGLMSRDWELTWTGAAFQPYELTPADVDGGVQPMSDADLALAAKKNDLDKIFAPPSLQDATALVMRYGANSGAQPQVANAAPGQPAQANPMMAGVQLPSGSPFGAAQAPPVSTK